MVTTRADVRFARPNIQIYDAHIVGVNGRSLTYFGSSMACALAGVFKVSLWIY
jgi:hypothetical protein